ncbi:protein timeless homolog [Lepeophtheirus salmonis]|uniref:protein timeless homolog n=1 Tax=Lepeophtheirus salmonis TaxID=72036 RepID=UPI001AE4EEB8|nr:protein timeless homolog [Lepeophtheirus salmonis]
MDILSSELQATCSSLGTWDGKKYLKEPDALECIKDLIRYLRRDDGDHEIRRTLGSIGVFSSDIIYILREFPDDEDLFDACLRLSVSLTSPELILFREELPEEKKTRNYYLELTNYRTHYKESLRDLPLWTVLGNKLLKLLRSPQRSEDQDLLFERILIFIRNVLQTPDKLPHVHDEIIWALHKAGIADLILFIASSDDQITYCLHVLEIISLIFRDQEPESLIKATLENKSEKEAHAQALIEATKKEVISNKSKVKPSRHSRFGGTFVIKNVSSISGDSLIYHKSIQKTKNMSFDEEKRPKRKSTKFIADASKYKSSSPTSSISVKLFLKEFCIEFLNAAYNVLMQTVRDLLNREKAQQNDDSYYLWALRFFMKFNRLYKFRPELVSETLNKGIFHYVHQLIEHFKEFMSHEKKNPPKFKIWSKRLHLGIIAYQELLCYLVSMQNSKDPAIKKSGEILTHSVFYESEYRDLCLSLLLIYSSERMSLNYLTDLVETTHVYIKIIEHMCKSKKVIIKTKKKKVKTGKKSKSSHSNGRDKNLSVPKRIELWTEMNSEVAELIIGSKDNLPTEIPVLFDPISDASMDQQRKKAIYLIQKNILEKNPGTAISILRASRDIWPENDIFGSTDVEPEDEVIILKDILITEIDDVSLESSEGLNNGNDDALEETEVANEEDEMEENEVEQVRFSESELNFKDFMREFINKNVCLPYSVLLSNFKNNSSHTNHCVLKMFHRIAFDHKMSAMLFHISIFESFRRIWREYEECLICEKENGIGVDKTLKEIVRFAKYIFKQFTSAAVNNSKIYMELCFWKTVREAIEVIEGYGTQTDTEKVKASYWSEEDEETLIRVFQQFKSMEDKPDDILDSITMFFSESGKSRRQVARKLKNLGLIQNTKEITRKPIVNRHNEWSEEDMDDLRELFIEFEDAVDPIARIKERLKGKKSKPKIISKILELELCKDPEKLKKHTKSRSRNRRESQDSDSLGSSSSDEDPDEICLSLSEWESRFKDNLVRLVDEGFTEHLNWIADCLMEEADDKDEDDDEDESVPLIAMNESQGKALESPDFQSFLRDLNFLSPNTILQEKYWRINGRPKSLQSRASLIKEGIQTEFQNYSTLIPIFKKIKQPKTKKTWLPIKRGEIDEEAMERINNLFKTKNSVPGDASNTENKSPKAVKKQGNKSNASVNESTRFEDSSSDSDDSSNAVGRAEKLKTKKKINIRQSRHNSSSRNNSSSDEEKKTNQRSPKRKPDSDSGSSSDEEEKHTSQRSSIKRKPDSVSGSSSDGEEGNISQRSSTRKPDFDSGSSSDGEEKKTSQRPSKRKPDSDSGSSSDDKEKKSSQRSSKRKPDSNSGSSSDGEEGTISQRSSTKRKPDSDSESSFDDREGNTSQRSSTKRNLI